MQNSSEATYLLNVDTREILESVPLKRSQVNDQVPLELEAMISVQKSIVNTEPNQIGEIWGARSGLTLTTMAMIIQGILAFLLWEVIWRNLARNYISSFVYEIILYLIGIPLFIGSVIGKVALIIPYNKKSFEQLGASIQLLIQDKHTWLNERKNYFRQWSTKDIIFAVPNSVMTINAATVFGIGLTNLGVNGIASLLKAYNKPILSGLAKLVVTYYFQLLFIIASVICNLLGFPYIHINATNRIKQFLVFLVTNPSYMHLREDVLRCLLATSLQWKDCVKAENSKELSDFLAKLYDLPLEDQFNLDIKTLTMQQVDEILKHEIDLTQLIKLGRPKIATISLEWGIEFVLTRSLTVIILAMILRGLFNFFTYTEKTMGLLNLSFLSKPAGILDFLSMSAIGLDAAFLPTLAFLQYTISGRRYEANIISWPYRVGLALFTAFLIGLAGFPNGYQEWQLGGSALEIGIAIFAAWIELFGTYYLIKNSIEQSKINKNPYDKLIYEINIKIGQQINVFTKLEPENIKELAAIHLAPDQGEKIRAMLPHRKCYTNLTENIRHCIWQTKSERLSGTVPNTSHISSNNIKPYTV